MPAECAANECSSKNDNTAHYSKDWGGVRYYCVDCWPNAMAFFTQVSRCKECVINHHAAYDPDTRTKHTVKFLGKFYELCAEHLGVYDEAVDYFNAS